MALASSDWFYWPAPIPMDGLSSTLALTASGHKCAAQWRVGRAGAIRKLYFRTGTVTTGDTLKLSLQDTSDTTGDPDGSIDQSGTVVVADADDNVFKSVTLGADRTVSRNDNISCVFEYNSYVAGSLVVSRSNSQWFPTAYTNLNTGAWSKGGPGPILAVEYSDGLYYPQPGVIPGAPTQATFANNTAGADEYGMLFTMPFPARCLGVGFFSSVSADINLVLYDTNGTSVLATIAIDSSIQSSNAAADRVYFWNTPVSLASGSSYRATIQPSTTSSVTLRYLDLPLAAARGQCPGGTAIQLTKQLDVSGSWTNVDTQRPEMYLVLDQADDGAGGGFKHHPGMTGFLNA